MKKSLVLCAATAAMSMALAGSAFALELKIGVSTAETDPRNIAAEQFAEEDKKRREEQDTRNAAEQLAYESEKILSEAGDKLTEDDKAPIRAKIDELREALKGADIELVKSRQAELQQAFYAISEKIYNQNGGQPGGAQGFDPGSFGGAQGGPNPGDGPYTDVDE